jgi:hypothetical protein
MGNTTITTANVTTDLLTVSTNTATIGTSAYFVANGNVGIGTTTFNGVKTVIQGTQTGGAPQTSGTTQTYGLLRLKGTTFTSVLDFGTNGGNYNWIQATDSANLATNYDLVIQPNGGNTGIGTSAPSTKFTVSGTQTIRGVGTDNGIYTCLYMDENTSPYTSTFAGYTLSLNTGGNGARTSRLYIDNSGGIGIGTTSPGAKLDVVSSGFNIVKSTSTGGYAAFQRYAPTGQQTYDFYTINNVEIARITGDPSFLAFSTGSSATERMRIAANGNVGIGTTTPSRPLEVNGSIVSSGLTQYRQDTANEGGQIEMCAANNNAVVWNIDVYGSTTTPALRVFNASAVGVTLVSGATAWTTMSDINLKTDLRPIENAIDTLKDIRCVTYRFKDIDEPDSKRRIGIIAQDIVGKVDEALDHAQMKNDPNDYLSVRYTELVPHLIKAIQELSAKNTDLEARLKALENAGQ